MGKKPFGRKLIGLHSSNAWSFLLLTVTGVILYSPSLRPVLLVFRVWIRYFHIGLGIFLAWLLIAYVPLFRKHLNGIRKKLGQKGNLFFILFLLIGLVLSGAILVFHRQSPAGLNAAALFVHDLFTWIGVPYAGYHALTRSQWAKKIMAQNKLQKQQAVIGRETAIVNRRNFFKIASGSVITLFVSPFFLNWLSSYFGSPGKKVPAGNSMGGSAVFPVPKPLPQTYPLKNGGAKGIFRPYTVTDIPSFTVRDWSFSVDGLVNKPVTYSWEEFLGIPRTTQVSDFHCVTGWSVNHVTWEGIRLQDFLDASGVKENARYVKLYSGDGVYTDSLTLDQAAMQDVMVAVLMDGQPIERDYGGPVRLIVPKMYAYKSVKWLNRIELISKEHTGYWEERGYSKDAWTKEG